MKRFRYLFKKLKKTDSDISAVNGYLAIKEAHSIVGSFSFIRSGAFYIVLIPIIFPLAAALLQALTKLLPANAAAALSIPAELLTRPSSGFAIFLLYIVSLALLMTALVFFSKFTWKFNKVVRIYRQYS